MNTPTIKRLKAAVAQFHQALDVINRTLPEVIDEANFVHLHVKTTAEIVTDHETRERLRYEEDIAIEDQWSLEQAHHGWQEVSAKVETFFPLMSQLINDAASNALPYEDFKANEAKCHAMQAEGFLRSRGLTVADADELWRQRLAQPFVIEDFGPIRAVVPPSAVFGGIFNPREL